MLKPRKGLWQYEEEECSRPAVVTEDVTEEFSLGAVLFVARAGARLFATSNIFLFIHDS